MFDNVLSSVGESVSFSCGGDCGTESKIDNDKIDVVDPIAAWIALSGLIILGAGILVLLGTDRRHPGLRPIVAFLFIGGGFSVASSAPDIAASLRLLF